MQGRKIPADLVEEETDFYDNMKGTNQSHPYCAALSGKIGERVGCTIYKERPSPCREFGIQYHYGKMTIDPADLERCNKARAAWNLPPLTMDMLDPMENQSGFRRILANLLEDARNRKTLVKHDRIPPSRKKRIIGR